MFLFHLVTLSISWFFCYHIPRSPRFPLASRSLRFLTAAGNLASRSLGCVLRHPTTPPPYPPEATRGNRGTRLTAEGRPSGRREKVDNGRDEMRKGCDCKERPASSVPASLRSAVHLTRRSFTSYFRPLSFPSETVSPGEAARRGR